MQAVGLLIGLMVKLSAGTNPLESQYEQLAGTVSDGVVSRLVSGQSFLQ